MYDEMSYDAMIHTLLINQKPATLLGYIKAGPLTVKGREKNTNPRCTMIVAKDE